MKTQHASAWLLVVAIGLAGCGGGGGSSAQGSCALGASAGCGGSLPPDNPAPPPASGGGGADPAASVGTVDLVASSAELASAGLAGGEVTVTALVKTAGNVAVSGVPVQFSADSGFLAVVNATSDASGKASARLGTGGSKANRAIKVSATAGAKSASTVVTVTGTRIAFSAPSYMTVGSTSLLSATLLDSAGQPVAGQAIGASARNGNGATVGAASDANGQVQVKVNATTRGAEEITLSALGATVTRAITIGGGDVSLTPAVTSDGAGNEVLPEVATGICAPIDGNTSTAATSVTLAASRGALYLDATCDQPIRGALALAGGGAFPHTWIRSENAGLATVEATLSNGARGSTQLEFVAPLLPGARVSLQPDLAVVGSGERSTLIAVVRDGTSANNLIKGATVQFAIVSDPSGGNLLSPLSSVTGSDGVARAVFVAGPADGGKDGTMIEARIAGLAYSSALATLTVNKKPLSIQFGTGNSLTAYSPSVFQQDFTVFVSDSAGNPVKDVTISAAVWATAYRTGSQGWFPDDSTSPDTKGRWQIKGGTTCDNEDIQRKGLFENAFDRNGNGLLDPGIPLSASSSGKTDALGMAVVALRYPRDRARWVQAELTVTGTVAGTESLARSTFWLSGLASDYVNRDAAPPGLLSPYGQGTTCFAVD